MSTPHNAAQPGDIAVGHEFRAVTEGSGCGHDRIFQYQRARSVMSRRGQLDFHIHQIRLPL